VTPATSAAQPPGRRLSPAVPAARDGADPVPELPDIGALLDEAFGPSSS
jgi:hypothetical protein